MKGLNVNEAINLHSTVDYAVNYSVIGLEPG